MYLFEKKIMVIMNLYFFFLMKFFELKICLFDVYYMYVFRIVKISWLYNNLNNDFMLKFKLFINSFLKNYICVIWIKKKNILIVCWIILYLK